MIDSAVDQNIGVYVTALLGDGSTVPLNLTIIQTDAGDTFIGEWVDGVGYQLDGLNIQSITVDSVWQAHWGASITGQSVEGSSVVCFEETTRILTPSGEREIGSLIRGDMVSTVDHGHQPIAWISRSMLRWDDAPLQNKPAVIKAGAMGCGLPCRDLAISPQHKVLVPDVYGQAGRLAPAKALSPVKGVRQMKGCRRASYVHMTFARHEIVFAEGLLSESFFPGDDTLKTFSLNDANAVRRIVGACPESKYEPARETLTSKQARGFARSGMALWTADLLYQAGADASEVRRKAFRAVG